MDWRADEGLQTFLDHTAYHRILSREEEAQLAKRMEKGDLGARDELMACNVRLVLSVARRYQGGGLGPSDLVQEGLLGLQKAAEKFDYRRGYKFSTYATWWVRKAIQQGLAGAGSDTIRLPPGVRQRRARARQWMAANPGRTLEECAFAIDDEPALVAEALAAAEVVTSLDEGPQGSDGDWAPLSDRVGDPDAPDPHEAVSDAIGPGLRDALDRLTDFDRRVVELRFGVGGGESMSVADIARELDRPVHAVQTAQRRALVQLRASLEG